MMPTFASPGEIRPGQFGPISTACVPYARLRSVWNWPSLPVMPWTTTRVERSIRMATVSRPPARVGQLDRLRRRLQHRGGGDDPRMVGLLQDPPALFRVRAVQADH